MIDTHVFTYDEMHPLLTAFYKTVGAKFEQCELDRWFTTHFPDSKIEVINSEYGPQFYRITSLDIVKFKLANL